MPAIRMPTISGHSLGRRSRNDTHNTKQSRIPAPAPQSTYKSHERSSVNDPYVQTLPPKAKFTKNSLGLNSLYTISKNQTSKKTKPTKCLLNSKFAASQLSLATKLDALSQVTADATSYTRINPYPNPRERAHPDPRFKVPAMPSLPFKVSKHTAAHVAQVKSTHGPRKLQPRYRDEVDDEFEASFISNMSLNSPPHETVPLPAEDSREYVPMDISPAPHRVLNAAATRDKHARPLGLSRTASQRSFGRDVSNVEKAKAHEGRNSGGKTSGGKRLARSALPMEWMTSSRDPTPRAENVEHFAPVRVRSKFCLLLYPDLSIAI
ncbi:hypothetical protein NM688_g4542 [Phlebia brevispora]|uniref:Uncharacterized protein n=1 Tax=Phlebia brevispora TaxID=194682 RepID=A0ACC1T2S5_9APHY|nr:hypothetical protein NM688_g4542 [Phlebia brevispora]